MFYCSTIRCSTVPPSKVVLFHHDFCTVPLSDVTLFQHQMFYSSTMRCSTFPPSFFYRFTITLHCSTIICCTILPSDVLLFHNLSSTVPLSYLLLFHHHIFHFSTIKCSTLPSSDVPLFHHQMFYCSTILCSKVPPSVFHCFTISVTLVLYQMVHWSTTSEGVLTFRGLTTSGSYKQGFYNQGFLQLGVVHTVVFTTRGSYYKGSYNLGFFHPGVL